MRHTLAQQQTTVIGKPAKEQLAAHSNQTMCGSSRVNVEAWSSETLLSVSISEVAQHVLPVLTT